MNQIVATNSSAITEAVAMSASLPALVRKAANTLANATSAAEVLEAKAEANLAYDAAKAASRFAKAKGAFDEVVGAVYRAQADALEIEAMAKRRLADEYDAAQARDEIASSRNTHKTAAWAASMGGSDTNISEGLPDRASLGVDKNELQASRSLRDAEVSNPGIVRESLDSVIASGAEPTKAALGREINARLGSYSGDNEWYTPSRYVELARSVLGAIDLDPASNPLAQKAVKATTFYTAEDNGLNKDWCGTVWMNPPYSNPEIQNFTEKLLAHVDSGEVSAAIVLTNSSTDTGWYHSLLAGATAVCLTKGRIRFESPTRASNSPAMGQTFFYFGKCPDVFADVFQEVGFILEPRKSAIELRSAA